MGNWYSLNSELQGRDVLRLVVPSALVRQVVYVEVVSEAVLPVYRLDSVLARPHISVVVELVRVVV